MSETHGDKAGFAKQRQSKILRRKRLREYWKALSLEKNEEIQAYGAMCNRRITPVPGMFARVFVSRGATTTPIHIGTIGFIR